MALLTRSPTSIDDQYADKDVDSAADDHASGAAEGSPATQEG